MRLNVFIANSSQLSRRKADDAIKSGRVRVDGQVASVGTTIDSGQTVELDGVKLTPLENHQTIMLNKPPGYVCSRDGQGNKTIYELLPPEMERLNPVGRLDKDSTGLLLMTTDGKLANQLTHPSFVKTKVYQVSLDKPLKNEHVAAIQKGVQLEDGISQLELDGASKNWVVSMSEGRNRQIRRTFDKLGYEVKKLHRTNFGPYKLKGLASGKFDQIKI